jgi:rod shape-determining protein MreC
MAIYSMGRRRVILLLVLTSILLITLDQRGSALIDRSRSVFALILEPFDAAARTISLPVENAWQGIVNYDDLRRENESLRAQIDVQRGAEIEARAALLEFEELLTLNRLLGTGSYPTVTVRVQGERASNFQYTVEIDKGSTDGIAVGMPVVNGAGLVGKITQVYPNSAIVLLVLDPDFHIGAKILTKLEPTPSPFTPLSPTSGITPASTTTTVDPTATTLPSTTTTEFDPVQGPLDPVGPADTSTTSTGVPLYTTTTTPVAEIIRETGALSGQGENLPLVLRFIEDSSTSGRVKVGSTVQTAGGIDSIAPAGLPIGVVSAIREQSGSRALVVEVQPAADLSKLSFLSVLLYVPNTSGN